MTAEERALLTGITQAEQEEKAQHTGPEADVEEKSDQHATQLNDEDEQLFSAVAVMGRQKIVL
jgi:hypothetical protein